MTLNGQFAEYVKQLPFLAEELRAGRPLTNEQIKSRKSPGVYAFSEKEVVCYIGRTSNLSNRHKNHCGNSSGENTAAFAFLLAREATNSQKASYTKHKSRKHLMQDTVFDQAFKGAKNRIRQMDVRFVEIADPNLQHLFELYASMALNSKHNKFENT